MSEDQISRRLLPTADATLLSEAAERYERRLSPEEYWWLGAGLAACTLAELDEKPYAASRIEQLLDRLGYKGIGGDWLQQFVEELASLNAEGLLWPVYQRSEDGKMEPTGLVAHPSFDADAGYFLALAHLAVALAVSRSETEQVDQLAAIIAELVEDGLQPTHRAAILSALAAGDAVDEGEA